MVFPCFLVREYSQLQIRITRAACITGNIFSLFLVTTTTAAAKTETTTEVAETEEEEMNDEPGWFFN